MSFISLLLIFKLAQVTMRPGRRPLGAVGVLGILVVSLGAQALSLVLKQPSSGFFLGDASWHGIAALLASLLLLTLVTAGLLRYNRNVFMCSYVSIALLSGAFVNPLSQGASPLLHKELGAKIQTVVREHGEGLWLCRSAPIGQFVRAIGLSCLNGVQQTADPEIWRRIDPDATYAEAWNRYAHLYVRLTPPGKVAAVTHPQHVDVVTWDLDEAAIRALGVRYLLWTNEKIREPWVEYLGRSGIHFIYKVRDAAQ